MHNGLSIYQSNYCKITFRTLLRLAYLHYYVKSRNKSTVMSEYN